MPVPARPAARYDAMAERAEKREKLEGPAADDMLSDVIFNVERGIERELEDEDPVW